LRPSQPQYIKNGRYSIHCSGHHCRRLRRPVIPQADHEQVVQAHAAASRARRRTGHPQPSTSCFSRRELVPWFGSCLACSDCCSVRSSPAAAVRSPAAATVRSPAPASAAAVCPAAAAAARLPERCSCCFSGDVRAGLCARVRSIWPAADAAPVRAAASVGWELYAAGHRWRLHAAAGHRWKLHAAAADVARVHAAGHGDAVPCARGHAAAGTHGVPPSLGCPAAAGIPAGIPVAVDWSLC
ncbi:hypothetical protein BC828DRAFT_15089, partial [Blastocladiella britannica]